MKNVGKIFLGIFVIAGIISLILIISADTPLTECEVLNTENEVYTLTQDVNTTGTCFIISANNITLDCAGYIVNYSSDGGANEYGIYSNSNFTTIKNCNITEGLDVGEYDYGIYFEYAKNGTINNNTITTLGNNTWGIYMLAKSDSNLLSNNTIITSGKYGYGIYLKSNSRSNIISNNTLITSGDNSHGFYLDSNADFNSFLDNIITTSGSGGVGSHGTYIKTSSNSNTLSNNTLITSGQNSYGINLDGSSNCTFLNNNIITSGSSSFGMYIIYDVNNTLLNNIITTSGSSGDGMYFYGSSSNTVSNNTITTSGTSGRGIFMRYYSNNNSFSGMNINTNNSGGYAFYIYDNNPNFTIKDSILNSSYTETPELYVRSTVTGGAFNFTNVTKADGKHINVTFDGTGVLNMKWYLEVQINDTTGTPIQNANITITNVTGTIVHSELTDVNGKIGREELIEYINKDGTKIFNTPHIINVSKTGFVTNLTTINLTSTQNVYNHSILLTPIMSVIIDHPKPQTYPTNISFSLNYTVTNYTGLNTCWYYIWNSSNDYEISNTTITCNQNDTFNVSIEDIYTLHLHINETSGKEATELITFSVSLIDPAVVLDYPANNTFFNRTTNLHLNFTAIDSDGLDTCKLYGTWAGGWHVNYTWILPESGVMNYTTLNLTDGSYDCNVFCNDTNGNDAFALNNLTFGVDTIFPNITINSITPTAGSQTFTFNSTEQDDNLGSCWYAIFDLTGGYDGANINISFNCNTDTSPTVTAYATYNLTIYANDSANNINSSTQEFIVSLTVTPPSNGGGGGGVIYEVIEEAMLTDYCAPKREPFMETWRAFLENKNIENFWNMFKSFMGYGSCRGASTVVPLFVTDSTA